MTFHHAKARAMYSVMWRTEKKNPRRSHVRKSVYPDPKKMGEGPDA